MSRAFNVYDIATATPHVQLSTSTSTSTSAPNAVVGCFISVVTNDAYVTFDGTTPSSTNGLLLKAGTNPVFFPLGKNIGVASAAGTTTVNILWLG